MKGKNRVDNVVMSTGIKQIGEDSPDDKKHTTDLQA